MYTKQHCVIALFITGKQGSKALCRNVCVNDQAYLMGNVKVCGRGKQERFRMQCSLEQQHLTSGPVGHSVCVSAVVGIAEHIFSCACHWVR